MKFNSKNNRKRCFSYETKASISFIPMRRISSWCPIMKKKEIIMWICVRPNWHMNFDSKKMFERKAFLIKPKHQCHYPIEENEFIIPNNKNKWGYYINPCLSQLMMNFDSKNGGKRSFSYETKVSISFITMRRMWL